MNERPLGRRVSPDDRHIQLYPLRAAAPPATVERILPLPPYRVQYDQGHECACVGFGWSWALSIYHRVNRTYPRYDPIWLWNAAKLADDWPDTNPGDDNGTSVRAGGDVLRTQGDVRVWYGKDQPVALANGIAANRWATTTDEVRASIAAGNPVVIGVNWYSNFDNPVIGPGGSWIGRGDLGTIRGGHCVCLYGASDKRQAVRLVNNWGKTWPLVWIGYDVLQRLLNEDGEAAVIVTQ